MKLDFPLFRLFLYNNGIVLNQKALFLTQNSADYGFREVEKLFFLVF